MTTSEARIPTNAAGRYAKQLCAHASHMGARAEWTPPDGKIDFPQGGTCRVTTSPDALALTLAAGNATTLATLQSILGADLQRFGHRDRITITWT